MSAQSSARMLSESSSLLSKSLARLSSGSKIVSPEDDAAGLAVSSRFDAQLNRINSVKSNVSNAISFSQTQDGFLKKVAKALDRMSELSTLAQDVTKSAEDKALYNKEYAKLGSYIDEVMSKEFNGIALFSANALDVTVDENDATITFEMTEVDLAGDTDISAVVAGGVAVHDIETAAATAAPLLQTAIDKVAEFRAEVGANISRLSMTNEHLSVLRDNLTAANSRIKDVDVAEESTQFARYNILVQAGTAMLAQANATPQSALRLLS
jgi:flagellin